VVATGSSNDISPTFSSDNNTLYFISNRDGFYCLWAQRLDSSTKKARGDAFAIEHFHHAQAGARRTSAEGDDGLYLHETSWSSRWPIEGEVSGCQSYRNRSCRIAMRYTAMRAHSHTPCPVETVRRTGKRAASAGCSSLRNRCCGAT
jgi:hypothetical protein